MVALGDLAVVVEVVDLARLVVVDAHFAGQTAAVVHNTYWEEEPGDTWVDHHRLDSNHLLFVDQLEAGLAEHNTGDIHMA